MTDPAIVREASDPATAPERLAALAHEHPDVQALIAGNPAAYDALLDWLAQYGDPVVRAAVAARRGVPAGGAPAGAIPAVAPAAPAPAVASGTAPRRGLLARLPRPLLFGGLGAIALVVALVVVLVVVLSGRGATSASGEVEIVELPAEPRVAWSIESLHPEVAPDSDTIFGSHAVTVGPHRAIVTETLDSENGSGLEVVRRVLLDTTTGDILWDVPEELSAATIVPVPGNSAVALFTEGGRITSVRLSDGGIAGRLDGLVLYSRGTEQSIAAVDGDVIVLTADGVARVDPVSLTARWTVDAGIEGFDQIVAAQGVLIAGTRVYSLADGRELSWTADVERYGEISGRLFSAEPGTGRLALIDPVTGAERWIHLAGDEAVPVFWTDEVVGLFAASTQTVTVIGLDDGAERWTTTIGRDGYGFALALEAGVVILPADRSTSTAYDLATGRALYDIAMSQNGDWPLQMLGATDRTIYFGGSREGDLQAYDARTGTRRWSLANPFSNWYSFAFWGGDLVAVQNLSGSSGGEQPHYLGLR